MTAALHPDIKNTPCVFFPHEWDVMMGGSGVILIASALTQIPSVAKRLSPGKVDALAVASAFVVIAGVLKVMMGDYMIQLLGVEAQVNYHAIGVVKTLWSTYLKDNNNYCDHLSRMITEQTRGGSKIFKYPTRINGKQKGISTLHEQRPQKETPWFNLDARYLVAITGYTRAKGGSSSQRAALCAARFYEGLYTKQATLTLSQALKNNQAYIREGKGTLDPFKFPGTGNVLGKE